MSLFAKHLSRLTSATRRRKASVESELQDLKSVLTPKLSDSSYSDDDAWREGLFDGLSIDGHAAFYAIAAHNDNLSAEECWELNGMEENGYDKSAYMEYYNAL